MKLAILILSMMLATAVAAGPIERRIYPAPRAALSLSGLPAGAAFIDVETSDGLKLKGIAIAPESGKPVLLAFHGNGSSARDAVSWLAPALPKGWGLIAAEYRGYSGNPGRPSEAGLAADADAFARYARTLAGGAPVWLFGHSLGGAVALSLAGRTDAKAVVTVGTFTRLRDAAPRIARAFVPDAYNNADVVPKLTVPYFLVHGTADDVIPAGHGQALHRAAGAAKRTGASFVIMGADHGPPSEALAAVLRVAARDLDAGRPSAEGLPANIKLVPFGQTVSLNP
ncbi:MAG TPA: alpha/beta fold hydrolase [Sphingomonadaceae bacterium]|nr:alpha/beta fold hydrolase [Sphingomonadaceae bacterium]